MSLRVLHVAQPTDAGVARYVADAAADQVSRSWEVHVASPSAGPLAGWVVSAGARHHVWDAVRSPGPSVLRESTRIRDLVERLDPHVVHLHSSKAGLAGRLALRGTRPTLFQPHAWSFLAVEGAVREASLRWERFGARWATRTIAVSEAEAAQGREHGIEGPIDVVPNGVDLSSFEPADDEARAQAREALGLGDGPLAVCVGRLDHQKGQDVLLRAWDAVAAAVPGAQLALVGDGPSRPALHASAPASVLMPGRSDVVGSWLAAADVVVMPSRWEGLSIALLEAMARARAVIATDVAGAVEALADGPEPGGVIVPVEAVAPLADELVRYLTDPELARSRGLAGRQRVEERYDLRATLDRLAEISQELGRY